MTDSVLLLRVIFFAVPGIAGWMVYRRLAGRPVRNKWEMFCEIVVFSIVVYTALAIVAAIAGCLGLPWSKVLFFRALFDKKTPIQWLEILGASALAVPVAYGASFVTNGKWINRLGLKVGATNKYGDEDVWEHFHHVLEGPEYEWVFVRDHKRDVVYHGSILVYSDSGKERELLLRHVDVYTSDSKELLYKAETVYLCRDRYDLTIETPPTGGPTASNQRDPDKEKEHGKDRQG